MGQPVELSARRRPPRRVPGRRDARAAPDRFKIREMPDQSYRPAGEVLANYVDQAFSYAEPVLDRQAGYTAEVTDIARDHGEPIG